MITILVMMQMPATQGSRPLLNPTVCVGLTAFVVGTALGIGLGVLIANNRYRGVGGGIWFGRKRRSPEDEDEEAFDIVNAIDEGQVKYE